MSKCDGIKMWKIKVKKELTGIFFFLATDFESRGEGRCV